MSRSRKTEEILIYVLVVAVVLLATNRCARADFVFGTPENLGPLINSPLHDAGAGISADGLSMWFVRHTIWNVNEEYCFATRVTKDAPWEAAENYGQWNDSLWNLVDVWPGTTTTDGLELYFADSEDERPGGYGNYDIWMIKRESIDTELGSAINIGSTINTEDDEWWPVISPNGLELYFNRYSTSNVYPGDQGGSDLWVSKRTTTEDEWEPPMNLGPKVNSILGDTRPMLSSDGLLLFFDSSRSGGYGSRDLYMTRRRTLSDPWEDAVNLGSTINCPVYEECAYISADGSTLYWDCQRPGSYGGHDIWQASVEPVVDFNGDGIVGLDDLMILIEYWDQDNPSVDIGPMPWGDGVVNDADIEILLKYWGQEVDYPMEPYEPMIIQDNTGFQIYADQNTPDMFVSSYISQGEMSYYDQTDPTEGDCCIYCAGLARYNHIGFDFWPDRDMTLLVQEGYALEFWIRGDSLNGRFDVRFIDTKTDDPVDHPWRMRKTISKSLAPWDGQWHQIRMPLKDFSEHGSWDDNSWFNPQGDFDWAAVDRFEIVAEHHDFEGMQFWFDDIKITE